MTYFDKCFMQALSKYCKKNFMNLKDLKKKLYEEYSKNKIIPKGLV